MNAPRIHDVTCELLDFWRLKTQLSKGRPFDVAEDVSQFSFDAIMSAAMGLGPEGGDIRRQMDHLTALRSKIASSAAADLNEIFSFPAVERSAKLEALRVNEDSLWKGFVMPWPTLYHRINNMRPAVRKAGATLRGYIASQIAKAVPRLADDGQPLCALDYVIQREIKAASKENRTPVLDDPRILEPIYGYLIAGHDTSSGSLLWSLRRFLEHPDNQTRIRDSLRQTYADAWLERRLPTAAELVRHNAYLDAFIEEVLRIDTPVVNIMVMTRMDTVVLGYPVPADTRVFLNLTGSSLNRPSVVVDESIRSDTSQTHRPSRENWDDSNPTEFLPERWLRKDQEGKVIFDASLGPALAFSAGNRGCWGKRLGYLELRIVLTLLLWSFHFELPEKGVSWETFDSLVVAPKKCIIRLSEASRDA